MSLKKILAMLLVAACVLALVGCKASAQPSQESQPQQSLPVEITEPYFIGKVLEKYGDSCLLEVVDVGNGHFGVGQEIVAHMNVPDCPAYEVGDTLTIVFDGKVTCSLPPQIVCVEFYKS